MARSVAMATIITPQASYCLLLISLLCAVSLFWRDQALSRIDSAMVRLVHIHFFLMVRPSGDF
jgi:hypothetical protein